MGGLLVYAVTSALVLAALWGVWRATMASLNLPDFNRRVLIGVYTASLAAWPLLTFFSSHRGVPVELSSAPAALYTDGGSSTALAIAAETLDGSTDSTMPVYATLLPWLVGIYLAGAAVTALYFLYGIARLMMLRRRTTVEVTPSGDIVRVVPYPPVSPFSFMGEIYISSGDVNDDTGMLVRHELAHADLGHYKDLILAQAVCVLQWFNPAAWLMFAGLKDIHEFQADREVLSSGYRARDYQLMLVRKAVGPEFPSLANSFTHSPLKARIMMMCRPEAAPLRRLRVLALLPALGAALSVMLIPSVAEAASEAAAWAPASDTPAAEPGQTDMAAAAEDTDEPVADAHSGIDVAAHPAQASSDNIEILSTASVNKSTGMVEEVNFFAHENEENNSSDSPEPEAAETPVADNATMEEQVFTAVEDIPKYLGGEKALVSFISRNLRYPAHAMQNNIQGRVIVQFVVTADGKTASARVLRGVTEELDAEALRVVASIPDNWEPGRINGKPVNVLYTLPIAFRLQDIDREEKDQTVDAPTADQVKNDRNPTVFLNGRNPTVYLDGQLYMLPLDSLVATRIAAINVMKSTPVYPDGVIWITLKPDAGKVS